MNARFNAPLLLASALAIACGGGEARSHPTSPVPTPGNPGPSQPSAPAPVAPVFTVAISPASIDVPQGAETAFDAVPRDSSGAQLFDSTARWTFSSSNPTVAPVSIVSGSIVAMAPGTAEITAVVTIRGTARSAVGTVNVHAVPALDTVIFTSGAHGWQPTFGHVVAGGPVYWRIGPVDWAGVPITHVHLFDAVTHAQLDSLPLVNGSASRSFATPGVFWFCTGGCGDDQDFGLIFIH